MTTKDPAHWRLAEVWGDTVDLRHLAWSIAIGIGISVVGFFLASRWLATFVESRQLAHAYAMLAGLAGCVTAGVICARAFPPKREVTEQDLSTDPAWRREVLQELAAQPGGLGSIADLPPAVVQELKELKLYELFEQHEQQLQPDSDASTGAAMAAPASASVTASVTAPR
ncbi:MULTISPECIES: hypothetical protein [unclassified Acidovorax]|uniref:hypothetical protein n=1 Tax=unclassified Acidovorax TaxID=2684926 RepID=UPI0028832C6A|nr:MULTISPECIES: hypothetical protein [unclassified Acidovorax]